MKYVFPNALVSLMCQLRTVLAVVLIIGPYTAHAASIEMFETSLTGTALDSVAEAEAVIAASGGADFTTNSDTINFSGDDFPGSDFGLPPNDGFVMRITGRIDTDAYDQLFMQHDDGFALRIGGLDFFVFDANTTPIISASGALADNGVQTFEMIYWGNGSTQVARLSADEFISNLVVITDPDANLIYEFSFDNIIGTTPGTVEGLIEFDFLSHASDSGTGAASSIKILSAPSAIPAPIEGDIVTDWMTQAMNTFSIVNGVITDYQFGASEGAVPGLTDNVFCLNNGGFFAVGGVYVCGPGENYFGDAFNYAYNVDGIGGVSFRAVTFPESDTDGDGVLDDQDNCPADPNPLQENFDGDAAGDVCDPDDDNDGANDPDDAFPFDPTESIDSDGDGTGDNADTDDDNDGQLDTDEIACGSDPLDDGSVSTDFDGDNVPDCVDVDDDEDGVNDTDDVCPDTGEEAPTSSRGLGKNRWALLNSSSVFSQAAPQEGSVFSFTTADTRGCSCSQIIEASGLGKSHLSRGCSTSAMLDWINSP